MPVQHGFAAACMIAMLGFGDASLANSRQPKTSTILSPGRLAQKACNPAKQRCCLNADKTPVPPGTRRGPYTCLPNGTWG